jgi:hypothetical protein
MSGAGSVPVDHLKPLAEWIDELGLDRVTTDLIAGRLNACWYDHETGEFHSIPRVHWQNAKQIKHAVGWGWLGKRDDGRFFPHDGCKIFAAEAQAPVPASQPIKRAGGRPKKYDWERAAIHVCKYIFDNGLPLKTEAGKRRLRKVIQDYFNEKDPNGGPHRTQIADHVSRVLQVFEQN